MAYQGTPQYNTQTSISYLESNRRYVSNRIESLKEHVLLKQQYLHFARLSMLHDNKLNFNVNESDLIEKFKNNNPAYHGIREAIASASEKPELVQLMIANVLKPGRPPVLQVPGTSTFVFYEDALLCLSDIEDQKVKDELKSLGDFSEMDKRNHEEDQLDSRDWRDLLEGLFSKAIELYRFTWKNGQIPNNVDFYSFWNMMSAWELVDKFRHVSEKVGQYSNSFHGLHTVNKLMDYFGTFFSREHPEAVQYMLTGSLEGLSPTKQYWAALHKRFSDKKTSVDCDNQLESIFNEFNDRMVGFLQRSHGARYDYTMFPDKRVAAALSAVAEKNNAERGIQSASTELEGYFTRMLGVYSKFYGSVPQMTILYVEKRLTSWSDKILDTCYDLIEAGIQATKDVNLAAGSRAGHVAFETAWALLNPDDQKCKVMGWLTALGTFLQNRINQSQSSLPEADITKKLLAQYKEPRRMVERKDLLSRLILAESKHARKMQVINVKWINWINETEQNRINALKQIDPMLGQSCQDTINNTAQQLQVEREKIADLMSNQAGLARKELFEEREKVLKIVVAEGMPYRYDPWIKKKVEAAQAILDGPTKSAQQNNNPATGGLTAPRPSRQPQNPTRAPPVAPGSTMPQQHSIVNRPPPTVPPVPPGSTRPAPIPPMSTAPQPSNAYTGSTQNPVPGVGTNRNSARAPPSKQTSTSHQPPGNTSTQASITGERRSAPYHHIPRSSSTTQNSTPSNTQSQVTTTYAPAQSSHYTTASNPIPQFSQLNITGQQVSRPPTQTPAPGGVLVPPSTTAPPNYASYNRQNSTAVQPTPAPGPHVTHPPGPTSYQPTYTPNSQGPGAAPPPPPPPPPPQQQAPPPAAAFNPQASQGYPQPPPGPNPYPYYYPPAPPPQPTAPVAGGYFVWQPDQPSYQQPQPPQQPVQYQQYVSQQYAPPQQPQLIIPPSNSWRTKIF